MQLTHRSLVYARANQSRFLAELEEFVSFPSVSAQPEHAIDLKRCAEWLAKHLRGLGLDKVRVIQTQEDIRSFMRNGSTRLRLPTMLVYGHSGSPTAGPSGCMGVASIRADRAWQRSVQQGRIRR